MAVEVNQDLNPIGADPLGNPARGPAVHVHETFRLILDPAPIDAAIVGAGGVSGHGEMRPIMEREEVPQDVPDGVAPIVRRQIADREPPARYNTSRRGRQSVLRGGHGRGDPYSKPLYDRPEG